MTSSPSSVLNERIRRYPSIDRLVLIRNFAYGAAAVCLAMLVGITQVGANDSSLHMSVYASILAMPLWVMIGAAVEYYILLGPSSYPHFRSSSQSVPAALALLVASGALWLAIVGVVHFLVPLAAWLFALVCLIVSLLYWRFHLNLADWLVHAEHEQELT